MGRLPQCNHLLKHMLNDIPMAELWRAPAVQMEISRLRERAEPLKLA
jgi:hypothetical protein